MYRVLRLFAKIPPVRLALRYWMAWQFKRFSENPAHLSSYPPEMRGHAAQKKPISYYVKLLDRYIPEVVNKDVS